MRLSRRCRAAAVLLAYMSVGVVPASADAAHDPTVFCTTYTRVASVLVYAGYATTPTGHAPPLALTVTCTYTGDNGSFVGSTTTPGPIAMTTGSAIVGPGDVTVCGSARAIYADGHIGAAAEQCNVIPGLPGPLPVPDQPVLDPEAPVCVSQRVQAIGTNVAGFLLVAVARAPVRTVPAMSSGLTCYLRLNDGTVVPATGNVPGAVGVLAQYVAAPFLPITQRCTHFVVNYLSGAPYTDDRCEAV